MKWAHKLIGDLCLHTDQCDPRDCPDEPFEYIDISSVDKNLKAVIGSQTIIGAEAPSRARKQIQFGDILVATVRPNLNAVAIIAEELDDQIASTGFCVLRADTKVLHNRYLFYRTITPEFVGHLVAQMRGANYPAVTDQAVKDVPIPLPPLSEQRRIVEILDQADDLRKKRAEADAKTSRILPAIFYRMFGDPANNPMGWPVVNLGNLISEGPQNGLYKHASHYGDGTPILRIDSFYDGKVTNLEGLRRLRLSEADTVRYKLEMDDIVINRVNSLEFLGKSALIPQLPETTVFESNMMRFSVDQGCILPEFLIELLQLPFAKHQILRRAKDAINQSSINQQDVKGLQIPLPNLDLQIAFTNKVKALRTSNNMAADCRIAVDAIFQSLLHRAFSGDLTARWREAHMEELLEEMEHQALALGVGAIQ